MAGLGVFDDPDAVRGRLRAWIERHAPAGLARFTSWDERSGGADARAATPEYAEWEGRLLDAGLICPAWPAGYGGAGLGPEALRILADECERAGVPRIGRGPGERVIGPTVIAHGTAAQRDAVLPRILSGEHRYCVAFSEPGSGSDLASAVTTGRVTGNEILLTGHKTMVSEAERSNMAAVLCRTGSDVPDHRGLSYVLVPLDRHNGIECRPVRQLAGTPDLHDIRFDGARAPLRNVIGGIGNGWEPAMTTLDHQRGGDAAIACLRLEAEFWDLVDEVRKAGRAADPVVRDRLAWAYTRIALLRFLGSDARPGQACGVAGLLGTEYRRRFGEIAMELTGPGALVRPDGAGYGTDRWQHLFLTGRGATIGSGTSEIRRNILAERVLGLPKH